MPHSPLANEWLRVFSLGINFESWLVGASIARSVQLQVKLRFLSSLRPGLRLRQPQLITCRKSRKVLIVLGLHFQHHTPWWWHAKSHCVEAQIKIRFLFSSNWLDTPCWNKTIIGQGAVGVSSHEQHGAQRLRFRAPFSMHAFQYLGEPAIHHHRHHRLTSGVRLAMRQWGQESGYTDKVKSIKSVEIYWDPEIIADRQKTKNKHRINNRWAACITWLDSTKNMSYTKMDYVLTRKARPYGLHNFGYTLNSETQSPISWQNSIFFGGSVVLWLIIIALPYITLQYITFYTYMNRCWKFDEVSLSN